MSKFNQYLTAKKNYDSIYPVNTSAAMFEKYTDEFNAALLEFINDEKEVLSVYKNPEKFNQFTASDKAMIAGRYSHIMRSMILRGELAQLGEFLSIAVTSYVINVDPVVEALKRPHSLEIPTRHSATLEERKQICLRIASSPEFVSKLNPAAEILFFAFLKQLNLSRGELSALPRPIQISIQHAYGDLPLDFSQEGFHFNTFLLPELARNLQRVSHGSLLSHQCHYAVKHHSSLAKAIAEVLIRDPNLVRNQTVFKPSLQARVSLAFQHEHVARLLIIHPEYRGQEGEVTEDKLQEIAEHHGGGVLDCYKLAVQLNAQLTKKQKFSDVSAQQLGASMSKAALKTHSVPTEALLDNQASIQAGCGQ